MKNQKKEYYIKNGRLDLSTLDQFKWEVSEEILLDKQYTEERINKNHPHNIYKSEQIESILQEMGEYFNHK